MENNLAASYEEGLISFTTLDDDVFAIRGMNFSPGQEVEVFTKNGEKKTVVVDEILENNNGILTATFTWVNPLEDVLTNGKRVFIQSDDGTWYVKGKGLLPGEQTLVTTRNGQKKTVIIKQIIEDENGIQTASFENISQDLNTLLEDGKLIFVKNGDAYFVKGKNLTPSTIVKVTKANGKKVKVTLNTVFPPDENGYQSATFDWEKQNHERKK